MEYALEWHDYVGSLGVVFIVGCYLLMQLGILSGERILFAALNAVGAALVLISLYYKFNLSAFIVELFWLIISLLGIAIKLKNRTQAGIPE